MLGRYRGIPFRRILVAVRHHVCHCLHCIGRTVADRLRFVESEVTIILLLFVDGDSEREFVGLRARQQACFEKSCAQKDPKKISNLVKTEPKVHNGIESVLREHGPGQR